MYPNPVEDELFVESNEDVTMSLYDLVGSKVKTITSNQWNYISNLKSGVYILSSEDASLQFEEKITVK